MLLQEVFVLNTGMKVPTQMHARSPRVTYARLSRLGHVARVQALQGDLSGASGVNAYLPE